MTQGYWEQQFNERLDALKAQGLVDMKFTTNQIAAGLMTREEFFKEACHMIDVVEKGEGREVDVDARIACVEVCACKQSFDLQRMREVARKQAERLAPVFEAAVDRADLRGIQEILKSAGYEDALADTQRAIIEAAERRGYERALAEVASMRADAERYRFEAAFRKTFNATKKTTGE